MNNQVILGYITSFDAAHFLPNHKGKCKQMHGHTYEVRVEIQGPVNTKEDHESFGMVIDYKVLSAIIEKYTGRLDHQVLNEALKADWDEGVLIYPTAEHIAFWFYNHILKELPFPLTLKKVRIYEQEDCYAEVNSD